MKRNIRTKAEKIAHLERSIAKFGDADGTRAAKLKALKGEKA